MKKLLSLCLSLVMVFGVFTTTAFAAEKTAAPTNSQVLVNGKNVAFDAYTIDGNNYFKLRDLALALNGSNKQFEVTWDGSKNAIDLIPAKAYTTAGGELQKGDGKAKSASLSTSTTYLSGKKAALTAYTINGNNYFKLRDLMQALDVYVGWDGGKNLITLDTSKGYVVPDSGSGSGAAVKEIILPITLTNKTGVDIHLLSMSPAKDENWGENLLYNPLRNGEACAIEMVITADSLVWDLVVEDGEGTQLNFWGIDFSDVDVSGGKLVLTTEKGEYVALLS